MSIRRPLSGSLLALATLALLGPGCANRGGPGSSGDEESGTGESGSTGGDSGTTEEDSGSFLESDSGSTTMAEPLPNGSECTGDEDCESGHCYVTPLGSVCSECESGMDCRDAGTGINCTFNGMFFMCSDGSAGQMCDDAESCMMDLYCAKLFESGGFIPDTFCSECDTSAHCMDPQVCNPQFDAGMMSGEKKCVDPMTVPNDMMCDAEGDGDLACMSGHCTVADLMGFVMIGVCGECDTEMDCQMGQMCVPAMIDLMTMMAVGSHCE